MKHKILTSIFAAALFVVMQQTASAAYQQIFTISAYYSPIPGQTHYVTGSYEGDIRLNGSGVRSADGTPVYPGMIAAPSTYAFGTKMNIPGIGVVAVHDRGGAIVHAGERGQYYDRLDVWMGYGDAGLSRALNWGKRNVEVTVYGIDPSIEPNVYLEGFSQAEKFIRTVVDEQRIFNTDLMYGDTGDKVEELQNYLTQLGYYKGTIDGIYGDAVYKAVINFQIDQNIIDAAEEFGAGYLGPRTREKLEAIIQRKEEIEMPDYNLGKDDTGDSVKKLQESLQKLGYDVEINGVYDEKTIDAVFEFQRENDIVNNEYDLGAGFFGPQTFKVLSQKLIDLENTPLEEETTAYASAEIEAHYDKFETNLGLGDSGDEVTRLQQELTNLHLFNTQITGYYGEVTAHAVFKFQQRKGIVQTKEDEGAGFFGPQTQTALNVIVGQRAFKEAKVNIKSESINQ